MNAIHHHPIKREINHNPRRAGENPQTMV